MYVRFVSWVLQGRFNPIILSRFFLFFRFWVHTTQQGRGKRGHGLGACRFGRLAGGAMEVIERPVSYSLKPSVNPTILFFALNSILCPVCILPCVSRLLGCPGSFKPTNFSLVVPFPNSHVQLFFSVTRRRYCFICLGGRGTGGCFYVARTRQLPPLFHRISGNGRADWVHLLVQIQYCGAVPCWGGYHRKDHIFNEKGRTLQLASSGGRLRWGFDCHSNKVKTHTSPKRKDKIHTHTHTRQFRAILSNLTEKPLVARCASPTTRGNWQSRIST